MRVHKCYLCQIFRNDTALCSIYRGDNLKIEHRKQLCPECAKELIDKGWLVLKRI